MRERLNSKPDETLSKFILMPVLEDDSLRSLENMMTANEAHIIMLVKQGLLRREAAQKLCEACISLKEEGPSGLEMSTDYEDLYFNIEQYIIKKTGSDIGGKMHVARSRNDLNATVARMNARTALFRICRSFNKMRKNLLCIAEDNISTIFTAYTHSQPAQPTSFSHYILALVEAFERDFDRLMFSYKHLNLSPLGSGALGGTSFNIDRNYTAKLLGFDGLVYNSIDAIASRDYLLEITAAYSTMASNINRFVYDLYIWSSYEHHYVEVTDSLAACSSIMPQKKNPITFEHIKAKTSHMVSAFVDLHACMKNIPYSHCRDIGSDLTHAFWDASEEIYRVLELLNATLSGMSLNTERMEKIANENFSTVTELADELVRQNNLPFRIAHAVVGEIARECIIADKSVREITVDMLNSSLSNRGLTKVSWEQDFLSNLLSARNVVSKQISHGAPCGEECKIMNCKSSSRLNQDNLWLENVTASLEAARQMRENAINSIISNKGDIQ
jgi:argininosuccinate lyase